jgi:hypothetical protein
MKKGFRVENCELGSYVQAPYAVSIVGSRSCLNRLQLPLVAYLLPLTLFYCYKAIFRLPRGLSSMVISWYGSQKLQSAP